MVDEPDAVRKVGEVERSLQLPAAYPGEPPHRATLTDRMTHHGVPGVSVAVIEDGAIHWARGYGVLQVRRPEPVTPDTLFQAASISKPVTAMAVMRLVEDGRLDLDEDVNRYLKSWRVPANGAWQPRVTLRQLLSHSAGVTVHGFPGYAPGQPIPSLLQVLDGEPPANTPPIRVDTVPGIQRRYSGGGTTIVQQLLIDVLGKPFPELMRELVLDPLGMRRSTFEQPLPVTRWGEAASGHWGAWGTNVPVHGAWHIYPEMAAAGLWTTPSDLARCALEVQSARARRSARVLSPELAEQMLTPQIEATGIGFALEGEGASRRFGHDGGNHGFICRLMAYADQGFGAVVMTNAYSGGDLIGELMPAIAAAYDWPDFPPVPKGRVDLDAHTRAACAGDYELTPRLHMTVSPVHGGLDVRFTGQPAIYFQPESPTTFWAEVVKTELAFTRADGGAVTGMVVRQNGREMQARKVL